jgi:hypothetical protein
MSSKITASDIVWRMLPVLGDVQCWGPRCFILRLSGHLDELEQSQHLMATELRLPSCHAAILVAVLTLFYQTTDLQMWTVLSFAIPPYCASDAVADELYISTTASEFQKLQPGYRHGQFGRFRR